MSSTSMFMTNPTQTTEHRLKLKLSENKIVFNCHLNPIVMGELGEIGWYLKLELLNDKQNDKKSNLY
jgi:hypothetical protein